MKIIALIATVLLALALALVFWLRGSADELLRNAVQTYGSKMCGAPVTVTGVNISPVNGLGEILGLRVGNPTGFKTAYAVSVAHIEVEIVTSSLATDLVRVRRITVVAPDIIYEKAETLTNIEAIQQNIATYLGPGNSEQGKKLIVDDFSLTGATAQASAGFMDGKTVSIALPDIHLKDIGATKGGVTPGELGQIIAGAMKHKLSGAYHFDQVVKAAGEALDKAGKAIKGLFK